MSSVELRNIWKKYGKVVACQDVSWKCEDGEFFSLLGPSGCGKSSTMRMIAGLEQISSGDLFFGERRVNALPPRDRNVAMVFENWALYPNMSVYDNIAFPLWVRNMSRPDIDKKVRWAANFLGLTDALENNVRGLSGGQQQRVSIGRAIVREPHVLLMDEPISHLDASLRASMREELEDLIRKLGVTTIYVTHDQVESMAMADRIAVMDMGKTMQIGAPKEIYEKPANQFVASFIGEPPMNFAECSIKQEDGKIYLQSPSMQIELPPAIAEKLMSYSGASEVNIGIRPEDVACKNEAEPGCIPAVVDFVEPQGERTIITARLQGGEIFLSIADANYQPEIESNIFAKLDMRHMHIFDRVSGVNIVN
jgi:multiple sugar transport system ATP-binding protein